MKANGELIPFLKQKDYEMVNNNLGSGAFGKTVLLKDPFIDELFVAKKYEPYYKEDTKAFYESFLQEIKIMYKLSHRNIVRIYNYYAYESIYTGYIIMEYIDGQNINDYLEEYSIFGNDSSPSPNDIFSQLIDAFVYIESKGIIHRDIREGNILVDNSGIVKVIDFGLGKTFQPVDVSKDSLNTIIDRSGLIKLPNEYFAGTYTSRTDMFYLAELLQRQLIKHNLLANFSYQAILEKMMEVAPENRFKTFSAIRESIDKKDFTTLQITKKDKEIYQNFSNSIYKCISVFKFGREFVRNVDEFIEKIKIAIKKNCFEDYIQNNGDLIYTVVKKGCKYYPNIKIECSVVTDFLSWFERLTNESKQLVLNNIIAKISTINFEKEDDDIPF